MAQLRFFEDPEAAPSVALAPFPPSVAALAERLPRALRFGTMSWTYPGWIGPFYAEGTKAKILSSRGLSAYATHPLLRTVEIDRTYYAPILAETFAELAAQTPEDFRFVVKAHEDCTVVEFPRHPRYGARAGRRNPHLLDPAYAIDCVIAPLVEGLGPKAGVLLFQFSPFRVRSPGRFAEKVHAFLAALPKGLDYAVELRNPELLTEAYGAALAEVGALHCYTQWERMPSVLEQRARLPEATRRVLLVRWLTRAGEKYEALSERYAPFDRLKEEDVPRRREIAALVDEEVRIDTDGYVLVSNKAEGCAPESVVRLVLELEGQRMR